MLADTPRGSGGIGRRTSLRGWRPQGREGSSPFFRTNLKDQEGNCLLAGASSSAGTSAGALSAPVAPTVGRVSTFRSLRETAFSVGWDRR